MSDKRLMALTPRDVGLLAAAAALILDQGSKLLMLYGFGFARMASECHEYAEPVSVLPFFNLAMVWNCGVSYGLFPASGPEGTAFLALFSIVAVAALGRWLWGATRLTLTIGLGLVIGGALGNLIDRLIYGKVADFFDFHLGGYHWYVFNVADAAITFGVIALLYDALLKPEVRAGNDGA
jgi:signal peptidase II